MRPYSRAARRPYPNAERALHQVQRALRVPGCPVCGHPVRSHAVEDGQRVCTRGHGRLSCHDCAHGQAQLTRFGQYAMAGILAGMQQAARWVPRGLESTRPVVIAEAGQAGTVDSSLC